MPLKRDLDRRPYARLSQLKAGDLVEVDNGFACLALGARRAVEANRNGRLYIDCADGFHFLDGQLAFDGAPDPVGGDALIGVYPADPSADGAPR